MPSKKAVKPATRRAPKKEPPITTEEAVFANLVVKGTGDPTATNSERIEAAGAKVGFSAAHSHRVYHRKPVQRWIEEYRKFSMMQMAKEDVREMKRAGYTKEDVLAILHELATMPPERTKGSILGQVEAVTEMTRVMGIVVAPKAADDFFKGRSEAEIAHYAEHGSFTAPRVN